MPPTGGFYRPLSEPLLFALRRRLTVILTSIVLGLGFIIWFQRPANQPKVFVPNRLATVRNHTFDGTWDYKRDRFNLMLDTAQCEQAFPGLFDEIERPKTQRQKRPITLKEINAIVPQNGYVRAMIINQQLYIIATEGRVYSRELATLHSIYRAMISSPEPLPDIEFAFNSDDRIDNVALWGYARRPEDTNIWLVPDFGYWSWPEPKVGTVREVQMKAEWAEEMGGFPWKSKLGKLFWRGATMNLELREKFLAASQTESWSDVKSLNWKDKESIADDLKPMPEHCHYKYIAHTEGNTYSGRLKYLQNCRSVVVAHKMDWIQHHYPLMRSSGPEQNYVEVRRDWEDLHEKMQWLIDNDLDAERIAANNMKAFRRRYLTPAAEVCYWRHLIRSWAEVSFEPSLFKVVSGKKVWRGLPAESFFLERRMDWDPY